MKNNVLLVGINGVGKEHIRACNNLDIKYALYDVNIKDFIGHDFVYNEWGKHKDKIDLSNMIVLTDNFSTISFGALNITHAIIATPDKYHKYWVDILSPFCKILVEKPAICDFNKIQYVGYNDLNVGDVSIPSEIVFNVEVVERDWHNHIALDLMGHLYYTYLNKIDKLIDILGVNVINIDSFSLVLNDMTILEVNRNKHDTYLVVNGDIRYNDYETIFTNQLKDFVENKNNVSLAKYVESRILEIVEVKSV